MQEQKTEEQCFYQNKLCEIVKSQHFLKQQEASRLLSSLGIKTPSSRSSVVLIVINKFIQGIKWMKQLTIFNELEINLCLKSI